MPRYIGRYNWQGEIHKMWTRTKTPQYAHMLFTTKLAKKLQISGYEVRCYFSGDRDNYSIKTK